MQSKNQGDESTHGSAHEALGDLGQMRRNGV